MKDGLLGEFDYEMRTTRSLLQVVPDADAEWKPHPKSTSLGGLAAHVVNILNFCVATLRTTEIDPGAGQIDFVPVRFESRDALLKRFDELSKQAREAIAATADEEFRVPWTLKNKGVVIFTVPRIGALRTFIMNHHIHHRGQLSVYLRLRDVKLPSIYGPTADT